MKRPGPYICTPKDRYDDPALQLAVDAMGKDVMRWYGVWDWLHVLAGNQHRVGTVCVTNRDARSMGLTLASIRRFAGELEHRGKVCDVDGDASSVCLTIVEWRDWQSLSPAERSWLRRQRSTEPASRDSVTASRHRDRDENNTPSTSSIVRGHSHVAREAAVLAHAVARFPASVDDVTAMVQAQIDELDVSDGSAMMAAQAFVQRCETGGVPDAPDRGLERFVSMIEVSGRLMGDEPRDAVRSVRGASVADYAAEAIRGGRDGIDAGEGR